MPKFPIVLNNFEAGWGGDIKQSQPGSFWYSHNIDWRKAPSELTIAPGMAKESGSIVTGLVTNMIQLPSGAYVAIDDAGGVYQRDTAGNWTKNGTTLPNTAHGMAYVLQQDTIYVAGTSRVHSISNADGRFSGGTFTVNSGTFTNLQDKSGSGAHGNTYSSPGAVSEAGTDLATFIPNLEPLYSIKLWVVAKGSVSLTVVVHDKANNELGRATLLAAAITNGAYNEFVFAAPLRMLAKPNPAQYHFHVINTSGTASTVGVNTVSDLSTADYNTQANRFVTTNNGFHPAIEFLQYICWGNGNYLAVWEPISQTAPLSTEFIQHRLTFPYGYEVTSLALFSQYLAIACEKRSTSATNEFQSGKIFLWDGTSVTYNNIIDVPEGAPYAISAHRGRLYWWAAGALWAWAGANPVKVFQMRNTDPDFLGLTPYLINYPNTMTVRNGILQTAFPSETSSQTIEHGVYTFGQRNKDFPESFGQTQSMSTGSLVNGSLKQGMIRNFGDKMFLSWKDGSSYGVDKIDASSSPASTASFESLITDLQIITVRRRFNRPDNDKSATYIRIVFNVPLPVGCTVTPKYKLNRESSWELGTAATAGATSITLNINKRYKESQIGFDATCTTATPHISAVIYVTDSLGTEGD